MSQQYPQQQPGWGAPPPPQPPKKTPVGKILGFGCLGVIALVVVIAAVGAAGSGSDDKSSSGNTVASDDKPKTEAKDDAPAEDKASQADQFKACATKNGTATEKAAVKHVTKVTGADKQNNLLDAPEVFTDFTGGMMGPHAGDGKLIASAFASCYDSKNGLVTVYDEAGELLSNGNF